MRLLAALLAASALYAADLPKIYYSKDFPGSSPAHVEALGRSQRERGIQ